MKVADDSGNEWCEPQLQRVCGSLIREPLSVKTVEAPGTKHGGYEVTCRLIGPELYWPFACGNRGPVDVRLARWAVMVMAFGPTETLVGW